jgi:hypothetical protein
MIEIPNNEISRTLCQFMLNNVQTYSISNSKPKTQLLSPLLTLSISFERIFMCTAL